MELFFSSHFCSNHKNKPKAFAVLALKATETEDLLVGRGPDSFRADD